MKILIDIGHPAHVHLFKNFAWKMQDKGNEILFTCRDKEFEIDLLKAAGFKHISFGKKYKTIATKIWGLVEFDLKMLRVALKFKPDVYVSAGSMYAAHVSYLLRKPHITLQDSENMEQIILYNRFSKVMLTPDAIPQKYGKKQVRYNGFQQSASLHPNYFKKDDIIRKELGIKEDERIFLIRLVALNATHDVNLTSISEERIRKLIDFLNGKGHIFISSEKPLKKNFNKYKLKISPHKMHQFIANCDLLIGESGAMTNEAAYLGVPNVLIVDVDLNVHRRYCELGLKYHFKSLNEVAFDKIEWIIDNIDEVKSQFKKKSKEFIKNSIDLTKLIIQYVEDTQNK